MIFSYSTTTKLQARYFEIRANRLAVEALLKEERWAPARGRFMCVIKVSDCSSGTSYFRTKGWSFDTAPPVDDLE